MPTITITGLDPEIDGAYELEDSDGLTYGEAEIMQQLAHVSGPEALSRAFAADDFMVRLALVKIALDRAGKNVTIDQLKRAKLDAFDFEKTAAEKDAEAEDDALPPESAPTGATENASEASSSGNSTANGSVEIPAAALPVTGAQA